MVHLPFNPLALIAAKTGLTILLIFPSQKRFYQKYLKEKCLSEYYQQLSFKYFVRICFIFISMKIADDTFLGNSECEWV